MISVGGILERKIRVFSIINQVTLIILAIETAIKNKIYLLNDQYSLSIRIDQWY